MTTKKNNNQKLIFELQDGKKIIFTYKNKDKLIQDLKEYLPSLFPQLQHTLKEMLTQLTT